MARFYDACMYGTDCDFVQNLAKNTKEIRLFRGGCCRSIVSIQR